MPGFWPNSDRIHSPLRHFPPVVDLGDLELAFGLFLPCLCPFLIFAVVFNLLDELCLSGFFSYCCWGFCFVLFCSETSFQ